MRIDDYNGKTEGVRGRRSEKIKAKEKNEISEKFKNQDLTPIFVYGIILEGADAR